MTIWKYIVICILVLCLLFEGLETFLAKQFKDNVFLVLMQLQRRLFSFFILFGAFQGLFIVSFTAWRILETRQWLIIDGFIIAINLFIIFLAIYYRKRWWFYLVSDKITVYYSWYFFRHLKLSKRCKVNEAFKCLEKASQLKPDCVFIWCNLASFTERFLKDSKNANRYLAYAEEILNTKSDTSTEERAIYEHYVGEMFKQRGQFCDASSHLKMAYNLDPQPFRKKLFEESLKLIEKKHNRPEY